MSRACKILTCMKHICVSPVVIVMDYIFLLPFPPYSAHIKHLDRRRLDPSLAKQATGGESATKCALYLNKDFASTHALVLSHTNDFPPKNFGYHELFT